MNIRSSDPLVLLPTASRHMATTYLGRNILIQIPHSHQIVSVLILYENYLTLP
jgi:hypothetical protein